MCCSHETLVGGDYLVILGVAFLMILVEGAVSKRTDVASTRLWIVRVLRERNEYLQQLCQNYLVVVYCDRNFSVLGPLARLVVVGVRHPIQSIDTSSGHSVALSIPKTNAQCSALAFELCAALHRKGAGTCSWGPSRMKFLQDYGLRALEVSITNTESVYARITINEILGTCTTKPTKPQLQPRIETASSPHHINIYELKPN